MRQERLADPAQVVHASAPRSARADRSRRGRTGSRRSRSCPRSPRGRRCPRPGTAARISACASSSSACANAARSIAVAQHRLAPAVAQEMAEHLEARRSCAGTSPRGCRRGCARAAAAASARASAITPALSAPRSTRSPSRIDGRLGRRRGGIVGLDRRDQRLEQVEPPVDVAHRIDALAGRDRRRRHVLAAREHLSKSLKHRNPGDPLAATRRRARWALRVAQTTLSAALNVTRKPHRPRTLLRAMHNSLVRCSIWVQACMAHRRKPPRTRGRAAMRRWDEATVFHPK